ncbi:MAG: transketolase [Gemmatimonadaceae bacterium]|nr:transketolase [Gemmatimonadaceae bacterium]
MVTPLAVRQTIVQLAHETGIGHIPSCFSVVEILTVLYNKVLAVRPEHPKDPERDYFILSKGHAASAIFSVLGHKGYFPLQVLRDTYGASGSMFGCHPDKNKVPGIEASTGSLGHGMPFAAGIAMGLKMRGEKNRVFCLIGDGEANEGSIWETALIAEHLGLDNLFCVLDNNRSQIRCLPLKQLPEKWAAFGWNVKAVDGHSEAELEAAFLEQLGHRNGKPSIVIANTVKGKGASLTENDFFAWHHRSPSDQEYAEIMQELR